jgi:hypothetical protein
MPTVHWKPRAAFYPLGPHRNLPGSVRFLTHAVRPGAPKRDVIAGEISLKRVHLIRDWKKMIMVGDTAWPARLSRGRW